jgi:PAS domain S-box-containing protein
MLQSEPLAILLVNEIAEEIKQATRSFRNFFPHCRVEAVYSTEEAIQWTQRATWHLILIDECLLAERATPIFAELKRLAPSATIVLQTDRNDTNAAVTTLQAGADFLLYKRSPAFLTELMLYTKDAIEKRAIRRTLDQTKTRHDRLIDTLTDVLYELDADGRFVYLSPLVTQLLGYTPDELIGSSYSVIVPPDQLDRVRHCFNDRRTGTRASYRIGVDLTSKTSSDRPASTRMRAEISAKGLYDPQRKYLGTLGLLRDVSEHRRQEETIHHLERRLQESDRLLTLTRHVSALSSHLHAPHAAIQHQSQLLLKTIRESRLVEQVEALTATTADASRLADELAQSATEAVAHQDTVNDIIETILASAHPPLPNTDWIERSYAPNLPPFTGNCDTLAQLLRMLLSHAQRYVAAVGSCRRLRVSTTAIGPQGVLIDPQSSLFSQMAIAEVAIHIQETEATSMAHESPPQAQGDLFAAYAFIKQLGGRWDFLAPVGGLLSITVWLPVEQTPQPDRSPMSVPFPTSSASAAIEPPDMAHSQSPAPTKTQATISPIRSSQPLPDRRKSARMSTNLPARLTIGNTLRGGALTDLSQTGALLDVEGSLPSFEQQPASLILKTAAGALEIQGTTYDRGEAPPQAGVDRQTSRLAFQFAALDDTEHKVLASLIEEAHARTLAVTVEALLSPQDRTDDPGGSSLETTLRGTDHREAMRIRVALPVRIATPSLTSKGVRPLGMAVNFSRGGACLQTDPSLDITDDVITLHFSATELLSQPRGHEPEAPEAILRGRIVHLAPDHNVPAELKPGPSQPGHRVGIRFVELTPFAEREVNRVIAQHLGSSMDLAGTAVRSSIVSTRRECRNARRQMIAVTDDHARHQISPSAPIVLIIPGFGSTQTDYAPLSYYLAANRFRALRYDHTNHVGQSDGDLLQLTLRGMQSDLHSVLDFVRATWPTAPLTLLAEDIAARVAVKVLAHSNASDQLLLLNPVLDIGAALSALYPPDAVENYRQGIRRNIANLWGLNVNFDQFVGDAIAGDYADMASSTTDFSKLTTPPIVLTSPGTHRPLEDMFGPQRQSLSAMGRAPVIVSLQTDLSKDSAAYEERHATAFRTVFKLISTPMIGSPPSVHIHEPAMRDVRRQQQLEQERIRMRHHTSQAARSALWVAHLAQLPQLRNQPDYWALENKLYRRLLPLEPGMTVLDIGCEEGALARIMLTDQIYRSAHRSGPPAGPLRYIGAGYLQESLALAEQQLRAFAQELPGPLTTGFPADQYVETSWLHTDWNSPLPFTEGSIHRILCHLTLSFSPSPLHCLRQALHALRPDGRAVITVLQPHTDLTPLFRRHLSARSQHESGASAQIVLHYLGRLREAIRHGLLHSYERNELTDLLAHAGAGPIQIVPTLGNQLLLAVVGKAKSTG